MVEDMSSAGTGAAAEGAKPLPNLLTRFFMVFVAPGELFNQLKITPKWLGAFLLVLVLTGAATSLLLPEEMVREQVTQSVSADASPEEIAGVEKVADFFASPAGRALSTFLNMAVVALFFTIYIGIIMLVFNVFMGGEASFKQLFSFGSHASLISSVGALVTVPLKIAKEDMRAGLNLGLLSPVDTGFLNNFLTGLDIFAIWATIVLALGLSKLYTNRSITGIAIILFIIFALVVAIGAAFTPGG
jgi:hypothetical protein